MVDDASMPIAPPVPTRSSSFSAMRALARACCRKRVANSWGPTAIAPPRTRWADALVDEQVEVAPDRHLADVELSGELLHPDAAVGVEAMTHQLEPFQCLDVHSGDLLRVGAVSHVPRRTSAKTPNANALDQRVPERR